MFISEYAKISLDMLRIPQGLIFLHILKTVILPLGISPNSCNTCFGRRSSAQNRLYRSIHFAKCSRQITTYYQSVI